MAEIQNDVPQAEEPKETEKTNRFKDFIAKHPRATKVAGFTAATLAVVGTALAIKSRNEDDSDPLALNAPQDVSYLTTETTTVTEA